MSIIPYLQNWGETWLGIKLYAGDMWRNRGRRPGMPWGLNVIDGPQGAGKTLFMSLYLASMKAAHGDRVRLVTNYDLEGADAHIDSPDDFVALVEGRVRDMGARDAFAKRYPGEDLKERMGQAEAEGLLPTVPHLAIGVSEIHSWFNSRKWQTLDPAMVEIVSQQRKLRLLFMADLQDWVEVDVVIRRKAKYAWQPRLDLGKRLMTVHRYPGRAYCRYMADTDGWGNPKLLDTYCRRPLVQVHAITDEIRGLYNTYRIVETLIKMAREASDDVRAAKRRSRADAAFA